MRYRIYRIPAIVAVVFLLILLSAGIGRAEAVIDRISQRGVLVVGVRSDAFPFSYFDAQGQPTGYSIELVGLIQKELEERLGRSIQLQFAQVQVGNRYDAVKQGRIDLLCDSTSFSRSRAMDTLFSIGYFQTGTQLLIRDSDTVGDQFRIGVIQGTTNADSVKRRLAFANFINLPDRAAGMEALARNRIDALASDGILLEAMRTISGNPDEFSVIPRTPYDEQTYACLLPPGNDRFQETVNATLIEFMQGVLNQNPEETALFDRWFGVDGAVPIRPEPLLEFFRHTVTQASASHLNF